MFFRWGARRLIQVIYINRYSFMLVVLVKIPTRVLLLPRKTARLIPFIVCTFKLGTCGITILTAVDRTLSMLLHAIPILLWEHARLCRWHLGIFNVASSRSEGWGMRLGGFPALEVSLLEPFIILSCPMISLIKVVHTDSLRLGWLSCGCIYATSQVISAIARVRLILRVCCGRAGLVVLR